MEKKDKTTNQRLTDEEMLVNVKNLINLCKDKNQSDEIDQKKMANALKISIKNFTLVYMEALHHGLPLLRLSKINPPKKKSPYPFINSKNSLMIGLSDIEKLNTDDYEHKFKEGDKFDCTREGDRIILTLRK